LTDFAFCTPQLANSSDDTSELDGSGFYYAADDGEGGEATLYYDAEEGTLRDEDGDVVTFEEVTEEEDEEEVGDNDDDEDENEEEEEEGAEGGRTPRVEDAASAAATATGTAPQGITSTFPSLRGTDGIEAVGRPALSGDGGMVGRVRRASAATQQRVSRLRLLCADVLIRAVLK